jgi:fatty-acyl-CoA synthase
MAPSYASGVGSQPLIGETIGALLERVAAEHPDHEALVSRHQGIRLTYAELDAEADRLARGFMAAGLEVGDRAGIWAPNCAEWALTQFATAKAGIVLVNINPAYRPTELTYALQQSGCRLLVSAQSFKTSDYVAMVEEVRGDLPALERVIFLDTPDWDDLLAGADDVDPEALRNRSAGLQFDDPINIQYTSGTTGFPKGATLSHHNILNNGFFVSELCGHTKDDRVCIPVPLYHCFGMVMGNLGCVTHAATMVYPSGGFDPGATLETIQAERCTSLYGVPTMFIAELGHPDFASFDLTSLRTGIMAGSPCPVEVMRRVVGEMHMGEVTICYGMTETSPVSTQTTADDDLEHRVSTVGRVHPHVEVKIVDPVTNAVVERDEPGELLTRGYSVMLGYWADEERTAEAIDRAGWMHTGDLATMDADGYVNIVGRSKDMVIRGGENVYPREIEEFLYTHKAIVDVAVFGVPDDRYGEELCAWIQVREGETITEEEVREFCKGRIAHYKVPRYVRVVDTFPMTISGKVQKFKMREAAVKELGLEGADGGQVAAATRRS